MADTPTPGPLALVGSGEFLPAMAEVDAAMLDGRPRRVAVIPTAAGPEGDASVGRWFGLAEAHYAALDAEVVRVDVRTRDQAMDRVWADALAGVGLVYLSGGNPSYLADTLRGTPLSEAIATAWRGGAALAGCSAGAMALGRTTLSTRGAPVEGLGLAGPIVTIPHYDRFGFARRFAGVALSVMRGRDQRVIGVDEDTACVWSPDTGAWTAHGARKVWLVTAAGSTGEGHGAGDVVALPPPA